MQLMYFVQDKCIKFTNSSELVIIIVKAEIKLTAVTVLAASTNQIFDCGKCTSSS